MNPISGASSPPAPLSLHMRRFGGPVVGRPAELSAIRSELASAAAGQFGALTFEGEPGIGKTRLLVASEEAAARSGFLTAGVTADEEIRGPFLVARSLLVAAAGRLDGPPAERLRSAAGLLEGRDDPSLANLPPDQKLLRSLDTGAMALRDAASERPACLLIDDLQWVDEDTVRMLRYMVRAAAQTPMLLVLALRPEEMATAQEARTLIADMERMGMVRRLTLGRLSQTDSAELAHQVLEGEVEKNSAATLHEQAEGVPFIVEELARTYRSMGMIHEIDGRWTLARNVKRLLPSSVRTLIERRASRLPEDTRTALAQAAILGRSFHLNDLRAVKIELGEPATECTPGLLADILNPAVSAGLLHVSPETSAADYRFAHEQVREFAAGALSDPAKRSVHAAIVAILTRDAAPLPQSYALLAQHAAAAGDHTSAASFSIEASRIALQARAPDEVLRIVETALPSASDPAQRLALLIARDDALEMLRRPPDRLEVLAEVGALAGAMGDPHLDLQIKLRRAGALRVSGQEDRAAALAYEVRNLAVEQKDVAAEIAACLEMGQSLMRRPLGESFGPPALEADLEGASDAYERALQLAGAGGDRWAQAAAARELGVAKMAIGRAWLVENLEPPEAMRLMTRIVGGDTPEQVLAELPVAGFIREAHDHFDKALELFDALGDQRGVMSTIIAMAYIRFGIDIHWRASAKGIEEIRRLAGRMKSLTARSGSGSSDVQMLFAGHVFARAKTVIDLAISQGQEAHELGRMLGDRALDFAAAGGVALSYLDLNDIAQAEAWLDRASEAATDLPTLSRSRRLDLWRGLVAAAAGNAEGMREHFARASRASAGHAHPAALCEARALYALSAAKLGAEADPPDDDLLDEAAAAAGEALEAAGSNPGYAEWRARAQAALAVVAATRGRSSEAAASGRAALETLAGLRREDSFLDIFVAASQAVLAGEDVSPDDGVREMLRVMVVSIARRILDEDVRVRFFKSPLGSALASLAGTAEDIAAVMAGASAPGAEPSLDPSDARILWMIVEGLTNVEIAARLGMSEIELERSLADIYAKIGASSRAEAVALVLRDRVA